MIDFIEWVRDGITIRGWWAFATDIAIPLFVGVGSILVALFAWLTARKATEIARSAARIESQRDAEAKELRINNAIGELLKFLERLRTEELPRAEGMPLIHAAMIAVADSDLSLWSDIGRVFDYADRHPRERDEVIGNVTRALAAWRLTRATPAMIGEAIRDSMPQVFAVEDETEAGQQS